MTIWFVSDPHFSHANVIQYCKRPYNSVEHMNEGLISNWNALVGPDDTVYCLGDFSFSIRSVELFTSRLNGRKFLIPGNHDWCHPHNKKSKTEEKRLNIVKRYEELGWTVLPIKYTMFIDGLGDVNLCHIPYKGDDSDDERDEDAVTKGLPPRQDRRKFDRWQMEDDGKVLICGHVHQHWKTKRTAKGTLMINVGVDVWDLKPISLDTMKTAVLSELSRNDSSSEST